ncbi:MAG: AMP-binding protein [Bacilli bacterium]|nr:AMP-binding protein [Bacilli bacterium]
MKIFDSIKNKFIKEKHLWDKFYPKDKKIVVPNMSLYEYIYSCNKDRQDNVALNYFNRKITYYELFNEIDLCARAMRSQGIREGDVVSVCMANTPEAVIAFYAISKIGAIANMIHPLSAEEEIKASLISTNSVMLVAINLTYEKINNIIEDTNVYKTVIVSARDSMPKLMGIGYYLLEDHKVKTPKSNEKYIRWKDFMIKGSKYNSKVLVKTTKDQPAVILHSGGTTGTPKNILLSNGNINVVPSQACISLPEIDDTDKMLTILPLFHCFGLVECLHFPLVTGGTAILVPKFDASRFDKLLSKYRPTIIPGVPTLFEAMIKNKHMQNVDLSNVKYVVSGGDTLPEEKNLAVNKFLKEHNCRHNIVQGYGLSETSGGCVFATSGTDLLGSSGIPLYGNDLKIISIDTREELEPNNIGEIMISGPSVMLGYLNNQEETNEVLEKDSRGKIWVHTGDMGYINEDGILFFVQRLKRLIIVSGYNVFPSHIEEIIDKHEAVLSCCVVGIPHPYKVQVPKAFIVLKDQYKISSKIKRDIKEYCEKNLSKYMIPKEFEFRESLPKTMIGKVDYRSLEKESTR